MTRTLSPALILFVITLGLIAPQAALGADAAKEVSKRSLSGHHFIPSDVITSPFITTHFSSATGVGLATVEVGNASHRLMSLGQWLDIQFGLFSLVALRAKLIGTVASAITTEGALNYGAQVSYEYAFGATVKIIRTGAFQLSASLDFARSKGMGVNPKTAIETASNTGTLSTDGLFRESMDTNLNGNVLLAVAFHKLIGIRANVGYGYEWSASAGTDSNATALFISGVLSLDLGAVTPIPIGILGYYKMEKSFAAGIDPVHYVGGGIAYTGRTNFVLGLEAAAMLTSFSQVDLSSVIVAFRMRYYW